MEMRKSREDEEEEKEWDRIGEVRGETQAQAAAILDCSFRGDFWRFQPWRYNMGRREGESQREWHGNGQMCSRWSSHQPCIR